jgi:hypothetical protein
MSNARTSRGLVLSAAPISELRNLLKTELGDAAEQVDRMSDTEVWRRASDWSNASHEVSEAKEALDACVREGMMTQAAKDRCERRGSGRRVDVGDALVRHVELMPLRGRHRA